VSLKVIYFDVNKEPLSDYLAQCDNCGLRCKGSKDRANEKSENRHSRRPHSHLTPPLQRTPMNIRLIFILLETAIPGLHFRRSMGLSSFTFLCWAPKDVCSATERIIAVQGQFRAIHEGR